MTNHYARGTAFEHKVRDALREDGYEVLRSAGSKTKIDLVAVKPGQMLFVQCKLNGVCAPAERSRLRDLAGMVDALPVVAYSHKEGRSAAVVRYRLLTGDGPKAFASWTPDTVGPDQREAGNAELVQIAQARRARRLAPVTELLGQTDVPASRMSTRIPGLKLTAATGACRTEGL